MSSNLLKSYSYDHWNVMTLNTDCFWLLVKQTERCSSLINTFLNIFSHIFFSVPSCERAANPWAAIISVQPTSIIISFDHMTLLIIDPKTNPGLTMIESSFIDSLKRVNKIASYDFRHAFHCRKRINIVDYIAKNVNIAVSGMVQSVSVCLERVYAGLGENFRNR